jgi:hypothetical protein
MSTAGQIYTPRDIALQHGEAQRPSSVPTSQQAAGWEKHAEALADWTLARLAVRRDVYGATKADGSRFTAHSPVTKELLVRHFRGLITIGLHSTSADNLCLALTGDVDAHDDKADRKVNWECAIIAVSVLAEFDLSALICDSDGKGGFHVWSFFKKPVASAVVKWLADQINARLKSLALPAIELFPKQDEVTLQTPYGNWLRLPGKHHKRPHWTRIYDNKNDCWIEGEAAVLALIHQAGDMPGKLLDRFQEWQKHQQPAKTRQKTGRKTAASGAGDRTDEAKVRSALDHCPNSDLHYDEWLGFGMALNDWDQVAGLPIFLDWSRQSSKFDEAETRRKWDSFSPGGGLTIASVFKRAMDNGWRPESNGQPALQDRKSPTVHNRQVKRKKDEQYKAIFGEDRPILTSRGELASCLVNSQLWLANPKHELVIRYDSFRCTILVDGEPLSDEMIIGLTARIEADVRVPWRQEHVKSAAILVGQQNTFSSLTDWLDSRHWDGTKRLNDFFHKAYGSEKSAYSAACAQIMFISAVARAYRPGCQADVMVVLIGLQGILKSTGLKALCFRDEWYTDDLGGDFNDRKAAEGLRGKWLIEFGEFNRINRATVESVKSFLTRQVDHYMRPYARTAGDYPRQCTFVGTTNDPHPLQDIENRRFMPLKCTCGNIEWIKANRDQLWAEAVHRFKQGGKWWVTVPALEQVVKERQEDARQADAFEAILEQKLLWKDKFTIKDAAEAVEVKLDRLDKPMQMRIARCLTKIGYQRDRARIAGVRDYYWSK